MSTSETQTQERDKFLKACRKNKYIKSLLDKFLILLFDSYKEGHRGFEKQKAYLAISRLIKSLDAFAIEVFNELMYGKRY